MRAVGIPKAGGPEVLEVIDRPERPPGPGEVRLRIGAATVNPSDIGTRTRGGDPDTAPWTPGWDGAGTVAELGEGVDRFEVGDEVAAIVLPSRAHGGAQQESLTVPAASVVLKPDGLTVEEAATFPMNGLTALLGLELLALPDGATILVTGAAGFLGGLACTLAAEAGLHVIGDAKPEDEDRVRRTGAHEVVPRGDGLVAAVRALRPDGVDGVFDTALLHERAYGAARDGAPFAVVRGFDGATERGIEIKPVFVGSVVERTDWLEELARLAGAGRLLLEVVATYGPEDAAAAQEQMDAGGLRGRVLIVFD